MNPTAILSLLRAIYASKAFWPAAMTAGGLGMTGISELGRSRERKMMKAETDVQKNIETAKIEAAKLLMKESKGSTKELEAKTEKLRSQERRDMLDQMLLQSFIQSQDRQMQMILGALSTVSQNPGGMVAPERSGGMMGLMRSNL